MKTKVVHCKRSPHDVYIGRPSKWGNPFALPRGMKFNDSSEEREFRADLLAKYELWLRKQPELMASLHELRGKVLGCWCSPKLCHGDVLARLADEQPAPCEECGQRFLTADALAQHFREQHIPWPLPEIEIGESFDAWKERVRRIKKQQEGRAADAEDETHA